MSYEPHPIDTSQTGLDQLGGLSEYLAEQAHEIWAQRKMNDGWTYGDVLDDKLKHHPDLIAYSALPDSKKEYDRDMSSQTLKLILERGFQLVPGDPPVATLCGDGPPEPDVDDMLDKQELQWLQGRIDNGEKALEPLAERLKWLGEELFSSYETSDAVAKAQQKTYLGVSFACLVSAALAVLLAIYQLTGFPPHDDSLLVLPVAELVFVVVAVGLVVLDFHFKWKDSWLTHRSRAERLRSLKFRTLLDPNVWSGATAADARARVRRQVREINSLSPEHLWAKLADADLDLQVPVLLTGTPETDHAIGNYYLRRRLIAQAKYFKKKVQDYHHADHKTRLVGPLLFFGVLLFVFAHDVVDLVRFFSRCSAPGPENDGPENIGKVLITLAAVLPAASAALHVYRDGREEGRNHLRMVAALRRLSILIEHLESQRTRKEQIRLMVETELVLASEHEQWLQLMKECEWYG